MASTRTAQEFKEWLENNTTLSPLTMKKYTAIVGRFLRNTSQISLAEIRQFLVHAVRGKYNVPATYGAMRKLCEWLGFSEKEVTQEIDWKLPDRGKKNLDSQITLDTIHELEKHFTGVYRDVFLVQLKTGCRAIEAWLAQCKIIPQESRTFLKIVQKGGKSCELAIDTDLAKQIFGKPEYSGKKYPFLPMDCQELNRDEILSAKYQTVYASYWRAWRQACVAAGLPLDVKCGSHDIRRAVLRAVAEKKGLVMAQKVARHTHIDTTLRYMNRSGLDTFQALKDSGV